MVYPYVGLALAFFLTVTFLNYPLRKGMKRDGLPWYDIALIVMGVAGAGYRFVFLELAQEHLTQADPSIYETALFFLLLIAMLEATRRLMGWAMPVIAVILIFHFLFTNYFPGLFYGRGSDINSLVVALYLGPNGIFSTPLIIAATVVVAFVVYGEFLRLSGATDFFLDLSLSLFGRVRGGPAKVAVVASSMMATITGSPSANVATTGAVTIPMMKALGYKPHFAGAVEAVASKGGQITPPVMGAVAFIMAEYLGVPYSQVVIAAAIPAFLYYLAIYIQVDLEAARIGLVGLPREKVPSFWKTLRGGWYYLLSLIGLVVLIMVAKYPPQMAAFYSILLLLGTSIFVKKMRLTPATFVEICKASGRSVVFAGVACAVAGVILGSLLGTGLGVRLSIQIVNIAGGSMAILLAMTAITSFVMGMGMGSVAIYLILAGLMGATLIEMGAHPIAAHLFLIYWGNVSFITPPVAIAAFVAAGIAGADPMKTGWQACRLGIVSFIIPFMFVIDPSLLMIGSASNIALSFVASSVGVVALAAGVTGYALTPVGWLERSVLIASGALLIFPGLSTGLVGAALLAIVAFLQWKEMTKARARRVAGEVAGE